MPWRLEPLLYRRVWEKRVHQIFYRLVSMFFLHVSIKKVMSCYSPLFFSQVKEPFLYATHTLSFFLFLFSFLVFFHCIFELIVIINFISFNEKKNWKLKK